MARSARFFWACAVVLLATAAAIFFGGLLPAPYGFISLLGAAGSAFAGWRLRRVEQLVVASAPETSVEDARQEFWEPNYRRIALETSIFLAIILPAVFAGVGLPGLFILFFSVIAVGFVIEVWLMRRWMRNQDSEHSTRSRRAG